MTFNRDEFTGEPKTRASRGAATWIGAVVLSAVVGSGSTLAVMAAMGNPSLANLASAAHLAPSSTSASGVTPTSSIVSSVNVNETDAISTIAKKVEPAVMAVVNYQDVSNGFSQSTSLQAYGVGTGVFFHSDNSNAYMVTNNHVVQGAQKLEVVLKSGKHVTAELVGTDPYTDLAVIKIPVKEMAGVTPVQFANSDNLLAGQPAVAIGTPMGLDFAESVTSGIISSPQRVMPVENPDNNQILDYQNAIQTDAAINPGNSGGPLLNISGQVVGINSSKIVQQGVSGMGFAIPANEVVSIANQLLQTGSVSHPALGIEEVSLDQVGRVYGLNTPVNYGVLVESVDSSQAKASGLKPQDIIVGVNGKRINNDADLRTYLFQDKPGQTVTLKIYRGSKQMTLHLTLGTLKSTLAAQSQQGNGNGQGSTDPLNPFGGGGSGSGTGTGYGN